MMDQQFPVTGSRWLSQSGSPACFWVPELAASSRSGQCRHSQEKCCSGGPWVCKLFCLAPGVSPFGTVHGGHDYQGSKSWRSLSTNIYLINICYLYLFGGKCLHCTARQFSAILCLEIILKALLVRKAHQDAKCT